MRLLGLDPGLRLTGWGVIEVEGNRLRYRGARRGRQPTTATSGRAGCCALLRRARRGGRRAAPDEAAVEETFVNINAGSTLKLGQARGVVLLAPAQAGLPVFEYAAKLVKKSVVGAGARRQGPGRR